jgi:hypothetical protein
VLDGLGKHKGMLSKYESYANKSIAESSTVDSKSTESTLNRFMATTKPTGTRSNNVVGKAQSSYKTYERR